MSFYSKDNIELHLGDCRTILPTLGGRFAIVMGPPWGENPEVVNEVLGNLHAVQILTLWREYDRPPIAMPLVAMHIWDHQNRGDDHAFQPIFHYAEDGRRRECDLFSYPVAKDDPVAFTGHPHEQPVAVMDWLLTKLPADLTIVDPFVGSGTTLIAAKLHGRKAIGIEINEQYAKLAVQRLNATQRVYEKRTAQA